MLFLLKQAMEHFVSAVFSQPQNRTLDGIRIVVAGAMAAMADKLMRYEAPDMQSPLADAFDGRAGCLVECEQQELARFGTSHALFAKQSATAMMCAPELAVTKTQVQAAE